MVGWLVEKLEKIDKPLARLSHRRERSQIKAELKEEVLELVTQKCKGV